MVSNRDSDFRLALERHGGYRRRSDIFELFEGRGGAEEESDTRTMCERSSLCLVLHNLAHSMKIQFTDGVQFDTFSCVADKQMCADDARDNSDKWRFWVKAKVAIHDATARVLNELIMKGVTLQWGYDSETGVLETLEVHVADESMRDLVIENVANVALTSLTALTASTALTMDGTQGSSGADMCDRGDSSATERSSQSLVR